MITEYTDSHTHPSVVAWLVDERPVTMPTCTLAGGAWRSALGGWAHAWRPYRPVSSTVCRVPTLREARRERIGYGNGRRYRGHTSVDQVVIMSRVNIMALLNVTVP